MQIIEGVFANKSFFFNYCLIFRYLAEENDIVKSEERLANILEYNRKVDSEQIELWKKESKKSNEIFLGLKPGSIVSLADKKVFEPTHPAIIEYYNPTEPLADHLR